MQLLLHMHSSQFHDLCMTKKIQYWQGNGHLIGGINYYQEKKKKKKQL